MHPLLGLRIVVTRAAHQAEELAQPLRERGATAILLPMLGIAPPANPQPVKDAVAQLDRYDWIIFTSTNAIRALGPQSARAQIATVGAATRQFAENHGWKVAVTPEVYRAESLVEALGSQQLQNKRILIPSAAITRDVVRLELTRRGAIVDVVEAYRNIIPPEAAPQAHALFQPPFPDWITFASSSAVDHLASLVAIDTLSRSKIACIGPLTGKRAQERGLAVDIEPSDHTVAGLVAGLVEAVSGKTA